MLSQTVFATVMLKSTLRSPILFIGVPFHIAPRAVWFVWPTVSHYHCLFLAVNILSISPIHFPPHVVATQHRRYIYNRWAVAAS